MAVVGYTSVWVFYFVQVVYISVFMLVEGDFSTISLQYILKSDIVITPALFSAAVER